MPQNLQTPEQTFWAAQVGKNTVSVVAGGASRTFVVDVETHKEFKFHIRQLKHTLQDETGALAQSSQSLLQLALSPFILESSADPSSHGCLTNWIL